MHFVGPKKKWHTCVNGFVIIYPLTALPNITFALPTDPSCSVVFALLTGIKRTLFWVVWNPFVYMYLMSRPIKGICGFTQETIVGLVATLESRDLQNARRERSPRAHESISNWWCWRDYSPKIWNAWRHLWCQTIFGCTTENSQWTHRSQIQTQIWNFFLLNRS